MNNCNKQRKKEIDAARPAVMKNRRVFSLTIIMKNSCFVALCTMQNAKLLLFAQCKTIVVD
jgi:hypothetical protein